MNIRTATRITGLLSLALTFLSFYLRWEALFRLLFLKSKALPFSWRPLITLLEPAPYLALTHVANNRNFALAIVFAIGIANIFVYAGTAILATALAYTLNRFQWMWGGLGFLFPQFVPIVLTFLKIKPVPTNEAKQCVHCGNKSAGKNYSFRYGKRISSKIHTDQLPTVGVSTEYRIIGKREGWICRSCVVEQGLWATFLGTILGFLTVGLFYIGGNKTVFAIATMSIVSGLAIFWGLVRMMGGGHKLVVKANAADLAHYKILP